MSNWIAFFIGVVVGGAFGVLVLSLCIVGRRADEFGATSAAHEHGRS